MVQLAASNSAPYLQVTGVTKTFGLFPALKDISFEAKRGEFLCILGPSGCGKTTTLRVVAGLEAQDSGRVLVEGRDVSSLPVSIGRTPLRARRPGPDSSPI